MGYKSKYFTAERFLRWLKRKENNNSFIDIISFNGMKTINRIFKKRLALGEYNTIWERPDWRKFLDSEEFDINYRNCERKCLMSRIEYDVLKKFT